MDKKLYAFVLSVMAVSLFAIPVLAHDGDAGHVHELNRERQEVRESFKQDIQVRREQFRQEMLEHREEFKANMAERRRELGEQISEKRAELKERLKEIHNERKRLIVERIDRRMDELNERILDKFSSILNRLDVVLQKISARADEAEERGVDVSNVRTAIDDAVAAIHAGYDAIEEQADNTYSIEIVDEDSLQENVKNARQMLHDDLKNVRDTIKTAHSSVVEARVALAHIMGAKAEESP